MSLPIGPQMGIEQAQTVVAAIARTVPAL